MITKRRHRRTTIINSYVVIMTMTSNLSFDKYGLKTGYRTFPGLQKYHFTSPVTLKQWKIGHAVWDKRKRRHVKIGGLQEHECPQSLKRSGDLYPQFFLLSGPFHWVLLNFCYWVYIVRKYSENKTHNQANLRRNWDATDRIKATYVWSLDITVYLRRKQAGDCHQGQFETDR